MITPILCFRRHESTVIDRNRHIDKIGLESIIIDRNIQDWTPIEKQDRNQQDRTGIGQESTGDDCEEKACMLLFRMKMNHKGLSRNKKDRPSQSFLEEINIRIVKEQKSKRIARGPTSTQNVIQYCLSNWSFSKNFLFLWEIEFACGQVVLEWDETAEMIYRSKQQEYT